MQLVIIQESKKAAYEKMAALGFDESGRVGFANFEIKKNVGLEDWQIYEQELENQNPIFSIVITSNYHDVDTMQEMYDTNAKGWHKS